MIDCLSHLLCKENHFLLGKGRWKPLNSVTGFLYQNGTAL